MNNRKHYGLSFCAEGQITYTLNNKSYISDPHHAVILPKGQNYTICGDKTGVFPVINFECENFSLDTIKIIPLKNSDSYLKDYERIKDLILFKNNIIFSKSC